MALPTNRNLGDLRQELLVRLGFAQQGSKAGPKILSSNSFLARSQYQLYWMIDWKYIITTHDEPSGVGQRFYDWPDNCDPLQLMNMVCEDTSSGSTGNISYMTEGIDWKDDNYATPNSRPRKYERRDQIEIWPPADHTNYIIRLEYVKRLGRFTQDSDLATIDADLILLHALTLAKAHGKAPDAGLYQTEMVTLLRNLKTKNASNKRRVRTRPDQVEFTGDNYEQMIHRNTLDI